MRRSLLAAVSLIVLAAPAMAQETGTPVFLGPDRLFQKSAFGVSMSDPGSGIAIEGYYRMASNPKSDFGFRAVCFTRIYKVSLLSSHISEAKMYLNQIFDQENQKCF